MIDKGANLMWRDKTGATALHYYVMGGNDDGNNLDVFRRLLGAKIWISKPTAWKHYVNMKDYKGFTALHLAVKRSDGHSVTDLIYAGADLQAETNDGYTPIDIAIKNRDKKIKDLIEYLVREIKAEAGSKQSKHLR